MSLGCPCRAAVRGGVCDRGARREAGAAPGETGKWRSGQGHLQQHPLYFRQVYGDSLCQGKEVGIVKILQIGKLFFNDCYIVNKGKAAALFSCNIINTMEPNRTGNLDMYIANIISDL